MPSPGLSWFHAGSTPPKSRCGAMLSCRVASVLTVGLGAFDLFADVERALRRLAHLPVARGLGTTHAPGPEGAEQVVVEGAGTDPAQRDPEAGTLKPPMTDCSPDDTPVEHSGSPIPTQGPVPARPQSRTYAASGTLRLEAGPVVVGATASPGSLPSENHPSSRAATTPAAAAAPPAMKARRGTRSKQRRVVAEEFILVPDRSVPTRRPLRSVLAEDELALGRVPVEEVRRSIPVRAGGGP